MKKIKIISLGSGQSNFLVQLYSEIKSRTDKFTFHINNFKDLSRGKIVHKKVFDAYHYFDTIHFSKAVQIRVLLNLLFTKNFWIFFWFEVKQGKGPKYMIKYVKNEIKTKACVDKIILPLKFDIYHFHFCSKKRLKFVHHLPKHSKIVCSFWGSDLYRTKSPYNLFYIRKALNRASKITIQTPEMAEDLFEIHGEQLRKKVVYAQFAIETEIYKLIDKYQNEKALLEKFKMDYDIPEDNIVITIGYNANIYFKHMDILQKLNELPSEVKKDITCVLPLTYMREDKYLAKLYSFIKSIHLKTVCLDSFLTHHDIAKLRLITDIQIQLPVSDALSGSVTEVLYAGNMVIAGSWLPYGIYGRSRIFLDIIEDLDNLNTAVINLIEKWKSGKTSVSERKSRIKKVFFPDTTSKPWIELYNKLVASD